MAPNFWWVNQGQTDEQNRNFLSAPKKDKRGGNKPYYRTVGDVQLGDIIFHYFDKKIMAVSVAISDPREYFDAEEVEPNKRDKRKVELKYFELKPIPTNRINIFMAQMNSDIAENKPFVYKSKRDKYDVDQGYLFNFSLSAARKIREIYREIHGEDFPEEIRKYLEFAQDMPVMMPTMLNDQTIQLLQKKKQIILYGPPGTGKTYDTKHISVRLINGR